MGTRRCRLPILVVLALGSCASVLAQSQTATLLARLAQLPQQTHNSEIRSEPDVRSNGERVWIRPNEDDTRLYTPARGQMDIDFQPSYVLVGSTLPIEVTIVIATRGTTSPGTGPQELTLLADGRPLTLAQHDEPPSRSDGLLFLSKQIRMPLDAFLTAVTSARVEGQVWGLRFVLLDSQLELLRAFAARMSPGSGER